MMKKFVVMLMVGVMSFTMMACGNKTEEVVQEETQVVEDTVVVEETTEQETEPATEEVTEEVTEEPQAEEVTAEEMPATESEDNQSQAGAMDNFEVAEEDAAAFGTEVKEAVADQNLEALADLAFFPLYVGFQDGGVSVNSKDEFIALGAEKIFTQEMVDAIAAADENGLSASRAGFVLSNENGRPNIVFGIAEGKLSIMGMNY